MSGRSSAGFAKLCARLWLGAATVAVLPVAQAHAENIAIESDKTQLITISTKPGTIVVGNPSIADVSINGNQVFLHGHGYGNTNIIILDTKGGQIANFDVTVKQSETDAVTVFKGAAKYSMACAPVCEYTLQPGDDGLSFKTILEQVGGKNALATGSQTNEASAPTAPQ